MKTKNTIVMLTLYNYNNYCEQEHPLHHLESQKSKLHKEKNKARRNNGSVRKNTTEFSTKPPSAETDIVKLRAMATKLQKQYDCISKMMLNLQDTADNKKSESYSRL